MQRVFGVPIGALTVVLIVMLAAVVGGVAALAARNRVFFRLGVRNVARRRARAAIIVVGLMLGTAIIATALATGDIMGGTVRSSTIAALGQTDELVTVAGTRISPGGMTTATGTDVGWFPESDALIVGAAARRSPLVDGVTPAVVDIVAVQDATSRQNEARVGLFAADPARLAGFGAVTLADGRPTTLGALGPDDVYVNAKAVDKLSAGPGDRLVVLAGGRLAALRVKGVVSYDGTGFDGASILMPLATAQRILVHPGEIRDILVSNVGGATSGAGHTDAVRALLAPTMSALGLETTPVKQDGLKLADESGAAFMSLFTTFGTFTIAAGILLIFLIFVMLAAERRAEMGIARAVGTQRRHLVQMFVYEGLAYDLLAAAIGAVLGLGIANGMVIVLSRAFGVSGSGIVIRHTVEWRSLVVAYGIGVLLTFAVVTVSAWRVSAMNVVSAIRDLPEPRVRRTGRRRWAGGAAVLAVGLLLAAAGASGKQGGTFLMGVSLAIIGGVWLARAAGLPERPTFTAGGLLLMAWQLLPYGVYRRLVPGLAMNFSGWVMGGLLLVVGTTWTIVYNADLLVAAAQRALARVRSVAPVLKTSMANPLRNRFRTGATLALFTLVVFVLVVGTTTSGAFMAASNNLDAFGGGFQVRAQTAPTTPLADLPAAARDARGVPPGAVTAVAGQSFVPVKARQAAAGATFEDYAVRGVDATFTADTSYGFSAMARGYGSARQVWSALASDPTLAVVDAMTVTHRNNFSFGGRPKFQLSGFTVEDKTFTPVPVDVQDPQTGSVMRFTVVGVLSDTVPLTMAGITTSQTALASFGDRALPSTWFLGLRPGTDAAAVARSLESDFLANGMQADSMQKLLDDSAAAGNTMQRLMLGFMGLGLVIGVAALGVISARSVVERRQQIGVLRAIGFQRRMVTASFLLESSFVAVLSIVAGTLLGLLAAQNVIADSASQPSWQGLHLIVRWLDLVVIFAIVYVGALVATWLPTRRAAGVYPAAALRYQ